MVGTQQSKLIFIILTMISSVAFGQSNSSIKHNTMDLSIIKNENVRSAIQSLQDNNIDEWYNHFSDDVVFTDDGRTLDFKKFFDNAFDKKEKFLEIDRVENNGKDIYGNFYAGQWGTFRVYFKFHENESGKFDRIDIGQTK